MPLWRYGVEMFDEGMLRAHGEHLREVVPVEKLFWYEVKEGWGPLCEIPGVPVPDRPFPHNNSKADARKTYNDLVIAGWCLAWSVVLGVFGGIATDGHWMLLLGGCFGQGI